MKFFLPDAQDLVDPSFDFETEERDESRIRQRDDLYIHEVFSERVLDGILVSKGIVDGFGATGSRYAIAQRNRLLSEGAPRFFRLSSKQHILLMGDCGAFTYIDEPTPPYTVDEVINFYERCRFDSGVSVDHVILDFNSEWDVPGAKPPAEVRNRQNITLELAAGFLKRCKSSGVRFTPIGVAQGWSPTSYASAVNKLQRMGYSQIALGGMVPLKTEDIVASLASIQKIRRPETKLHLLGINRTEHVEEFKRFGVASFDSTSPLRQAFKDERDNYHSLGRTFTALRVPQVDGNPSLQRAVSAGRIDQGTARRLERQVLRALAAHAAGRLSTEKALRLVIQYEELYRTADGPVRSARRSNCDNREAYRRVLEEKPWRRCPCAICRRLKHHVLLFRGAERNRRRGFHNIWMLYRRLRVARRLS